jgi:hypothetical protein
MENKEEEDEFIWCLVGNIKEFNIYGEDKQKRFGTKYFSPGTKLYCFQTEWRECFDKMQVIGLDKRNKKLISLAMSRDQITNFRIKKIYNKKIIKLITDRNGWTNSDEDKEIIENRIIGLNYYRFQHQSLYPIFDLEIDSNKIDCTIDIGGYKFYLELIEKKINTIVEFKNPWGKEENERFKIILSGQRKGMNQFYYILEHTTTKEVFYLEELQLKHFNEIDTI